MSATQKTSPAAAVAGEVPILRIKDLTISVKTEQGLHHLVSNLSFVLKKGETLAIAGESGSGKSLTALAIMGLLPPPAVRVTQGGIIFEDLNLTRSSESQLQKLRGNRIAMIFQEPMTALNPVMTLGAQLIEAIRAHKNISANAARRRALEVVRAVRLNDPERRLSQYPHELSGGMR
ncbi:MAG: ABC transporter ATP-binding protein, partial [Rhodobacteraceae bacterium]|nr:ABC transporter ATP-binding protein [Paracoccaceae bacterium]